MRVFQTSFFERGARGPNEIEFSLDTRKFLSTPLPNPGPRLRKHIASLGDPWGIHDRICKNEMILANRLHYIRWSTFPVASFCCNLCGWQIARVTMDFHPQFRDFRSKRCLMMKNYNYEAKKKRKLWWKIQSSRNCFHVEFWHQRFGNKRTFCLDSWRKICVVANPHETHQQKPLDPITQNPNFSSQIASRNRRQELWPTNVSLKKYPGWQKY